MFTSTIVHNMSQNIRQIEHYCTVLFKDFITDQEATSHGDVCRQNDETGCGSSTGC